MTEEVGEDRLAVYPLFLGMTRPAMIFGVPFTVFVPLCMGTVISFLLSDDFWGLWVFVPGYAVLYGLSLRDPRRFEVVIGSLLKTRVNAVLLGSKRYVP